MALSYVTTSGTLVKPGAYPEIKVATDTSGLSVTGVLMLAGEADAGGDYSTEADLNANAYGPDQLGDVLAKYKSGPLVDAFAAATAAANDPQIQGSFSRAVLVKTNVSTRSSGTLKKFDGSTYATIQDRTYGKLGNLINKTVVTKQAEVSPATGYFAFLPPIASTNISIRVNGAAAAAVTATAQMTPASFKAAVDAISGVDVDGGADLNIMGGGSPIAGNLALTVISGNTVRVDFSVNYGATPSVGDTMWIPAGSVLAGAGSANCGSYIITSAAANTITARKLIDHTGTPNQLTAPVNVSSTAATGSDDVYAYSAMNIRLVTTDPVAGIGKSLEINELTSGTGLLSYLCYTLSGSSPTAVTWISKSSTPYVITSAAEYIANLQCGRSVDLVSEELSAGGKIALQIGYKGTTCTFANDGTTITLTAVGGLGTSQTLAISGFATINDFATYVNTLAGYSASAGSAVIGQQPLTSLDKSPTGSPWSIGSTFGAKTGRIKQDASKFYTTLLNNGILVQLADQPAAGLPAPESLSFLSGGTKGATTDATFNAAIDALEMVSGNFVVPLFSRDAVDDIADNLTDAGSSYTYANIHAYTKSHVLRMSTALKKRARQCFLSIRSTFVNDKNVASNLATNRATCTFLDVKDVSPAGGVKQFHPWMGAVKAAAMTAAAGYRGIVRKGINISGALQAAGDFHLTNDTQIVDALESGLLVMEHDTTGGWFWTADYTTYGANNNFVYNSIQATYLADIIALSTAQKMQKAFVGQSLADVTAGLAKSTLEAIAREYLELKLIAPSDDAPTGIKNIKVKIDGPAMKVAFEVKLASLLYFVPITISVSQVQQSV